MIHETFTVKEIDKIPKDSNKPAIKVINKIFSKVSRIYAKSELNDNEIILDVNSDLFVLKEGDRIEILLKESPIYDKKIKDLGPDQFDFEYLVNLEFEYIKSYEYVMHGVIFHSGIEDGKIFIYASFGGLLMKYFGRATILSMDSIKLDKKILLGVNRNGIIGPNDDYYSEIENC